MWYLVYSKWVEGECSMFDCSIPWRTIAKHSRQRTAEEECLNFVDKLEQLYFVLYDWVVVKQISGGYKIIHPKRNGTLVIDYLLVNPFDY